MLAKIQHEMRDYQVSLHMCGDALVLGIAVELGCETVDELELRRDLDSANSTWPHGAFVYSHELNLLVYRDGPEPGEDEYLEEDDIMGLFESGVEAVHFLMQSMSEYFPSQENMSLLFMSPVGRA